MRSNQGIEADRLSAGAPRRQRMPAVGYWRSSRKILCAASPIKEGSKNRYAPKNKNYTDRCPGGRYQSLAFPYRSKPISIPYLLWGNLFPAHCSSGILVWLAWGTLNLSWDYVCFLPFIFLHWHGFSIVDFDRMLSMAHPTIS
jgi:hypothetical protein